MIHPRVTMNLDTELDSNKGMYIINAYGIIRRVVCLHRHELHLNGKWKGLTIDDPTATLTLRFSWSFTETLTAVTHSAKSTCSEVHQQTVSLRVPAIELTAGSKIRPTHCLLNIVEMPSIDSTRSSAVIDTVCRNCW